MSSSSLNSSDRPIAWWLFIVMALVVAMIAIGGATRLTNSGLSITEWKPITGALPPLNAEQWQSEFDKYKQIPEFLAEHPDMDVSSFKFIYFWEWSHRQLGRIIGLAFALPFFWWLFRGKLPKGRTWRFWAILILIGLQGAVGWWMVASGLVNDRVDVSQYRLATHLGLAFIILAFLYWTWRSHRNHWTSARPNKTLSRLSGSLVVLIFIQILAGAFVAGTHAGKTYNTWPLMDGRFIPDGYGMLSPVWKNWTENIAAIQFNHRTLAYIIIAAAAVFIWKSRNNAYLRRASIVLGLLITAQVLLGIWTLLSAAPLPHSLKHQFLAIFVFLAALSCHWRVRFTE